MRIAARVDKNHGEVVKSFRDLGCSVLSLAQLGKGVPDLVVSKNGRTCMVEVKSGRNDLNDDQRAFKEGWQGMYALVRDEAGVRTVVGVLRGDKEVDHG